MLYRYGFRLGLKLAASGRIPQSLRYLIVPVNYWRTAEYKLISEASQFERGDRVLDIGSPKLLSLYLADQVGANVVSTDIEDYFMRDYSLLTRVQNVPADRFHARVEDGRNLSFPDNSFSKVYSLSVLEHIPAMGDTECAKEIGRVLAPGGICALTVPFSPVSRDEYKTASFYWHKSSSSTGDGKVFYQRRYSEQDLIKRIIEPSGLKLKRLAYVGEKVLGNSLREFCEFLPRPTGPIQPLLSRLLLTEPVESWRSLRKPLCALIVLEK